MQKTWRSVACLALGLIGAVIAAYLTAIHLRHLLTGAPSLCNINQTLNCDVINTSQYSELFGVPISHFGLLFYLGLAALAGLGLRRAALRPRLHGYLLLGALFAVGYSLFLAGVSAKLGAVCIFCAGLYVVNLTLLALLLPGGAAALGRLPGQLGADLRGLLRGGALVLCLAALFGAAASTYAVGRVAGLAHEQAQARKDGVSETALAALLAGNPPSLGPAGAPVTIIEISDFECPFCQRASETIDELRKLYPDKLRIVFRNFPLDNTCNSLLKRQIHENACAAARAALCAGETGQFFPYAEKLFHGGTENSDLLAHAKELGLSEEKFSECLSAPATAARLAQDLEVCKQAGVTAVPVFFVNGRKLAGAQPLAAFQTLIDRELAGK